MESNKRIRTNIRLELDATNKELKSIEQSLKGGNKDEILMKRADELRKYQKKLLGQYEAVTGRSAVSAAHLDGEGTTATTETAIFVKITGALTGVVFFAFFYNLALQALTSYAPMDFINSLTTPVKGTFDSTMQSIVYSLNLLTYLALGGIILALITVILTFKNKVLLIDSILNIAVIVLFSYPIIGIYFAINKIGDLEWLYYAGHGYITIILAVIAVIKFALFIQTKKLKVILPNIIEGVLLLSAGLSFYLAAETGNVENIFNVWIINNAILVGSSLFATIKYLLMD